jgi:hypothetical protein
MLFAKLRTPLAAGRLPECIALLERMQTGRFKVFDHLSDWLEEFRLYHRKNGRIVDERDDLMAATRYAHMMLRLARTKPQPYIRRPTDVGMFIDSHDRSSLRSCSPNPADFGRVLRFTPNHDIWVEPHGKGPSSQCGPHLIK